nr:hypothetical protein [Tanacetum cinerariifolium]
MIAHVSSASQPAVEILPRGKHYSSPPVSLTMSEEDQTVDIMALPKFDMPSHELNMSANDVKSLALRHGVLLDLHPVALTKGWTNKLSDNIIGLYEQYFEFSGIRSLNIVPSLNLFCVFYKVSKQGHWFSFEKRVAKDRRAIPDAMAWRHHDSDINDLIPEDSFSAQDVETLGERVLDFRPIPSGLLFQGGLATTWDFPGFRPVFKDTEGNVITMSEYLRFPFLPGATIEKGNALTNQDLREHHTVPPLLAGQAISKKTDHQKEVEGKRKKASAARRDSSATSGHVSSPKPIRVADPVDPNAENPSGAAANIAESQGNQSLHDSHHDLANHSVHEDQTVKNLTLVPIEVLQSSSDDHSVHRSSTAKRTTSPTRLSVPGAHAEEGESSIGQAYYVPEWFIHQRCRVDNPMWCWELMIHLAPSAAQEESNALENPTALERDWFALVQLLKGQNSELSQVNKDQAFKIKELEDTLARKDSALVYAERINAERAQEKERLVTQLSKSEMEKFNCIRKLLPTVVKRLFQSHEYKQSLSEPFNLAIQAGWGKGLVEERSKEDLLGLMSIIENFDAYADKKMRVEYDKLFKKRYPYVEMISRGFCHTVSDLLKVYLDSPPSRQAPPNKPSSGRALPSFAPRKT